MKTKPNPEVFARTVLSELARLRGEIYATRLRLYQQMMWMRFPKSLDDMAAEDEVHIDKFQKMSLNKSLTECGLSHDSKPPDTDDPYT
jgi:hypothetical protein